MRVGPHELGPGAALAPMAGVTNPPFRVICRELGASLTSTELISSHALVLVAEHPGGRRAKLTRATFVLLDRSPDEHPCAVQVFGRDPGRMAAAAAFVAERGAAIVDLNFGCPARKVVKNGAGAGAALLRDPPLIEEIARRVVAAVGVPVTAKIRLGWSPEQRSGVEVARRLEDAGVAALTVHARTRDQLHSGPVDLAALAEICRAVRIPVIGNGGIRSRADAEAMTAATGCAKVAVGQASRGNPWLFGEILGEGARPTLADRIAVCRRHLALYVAWAGEERGAREMRKHLAWYLKGFSGAAAVRKRLGEAVDLPAFEALLDEALERAGDGP